MSEDSAQMVFLDPWKAPHTEISIHEVEDIKKNLRVLKAARCWAESQATLTSDIFSPSEGEAYSMEWDIFKPNEVAKQLKLKRRTKLLLPSSYLIQKVVIMKSPDVMLGHILSRLVGCLSLLGKGLSHKAADPDSDSEMAPVVDGTEKAEESQSEVSEVPIVRYELQKLKYDLQNPDEGLQKDDHGLASDALAAINSLGDDFPEVHDLKKELTNIVNTETTGTRTKAPIEGAP